MDTGHDEEALRQLREKVESGGFSVVLSTVSAPGRVTVRGSHPTHGEADWQATYETRQDHNGAHVELEVTGPLPVS